MELFTESFTDDEIFDMALKDSFEGVKRWCRMSKRFNNLVSDNQYFWQKKFLLDFSDIPVGNDVSDWREFYASVFDFKNVKRED